MMKPANFYAAGPLDRAGSFRKDEAWLAARLNDPTSQFVVLWNHKNLVLQHGAGPRALILTRKQLLSDLQDAEIAPVFLGMEGDSAFFALDLTASEQPLDQLQLPDHEATEFTDLRLVGAALPAEEAAMLAHARGLLYWHGRHRFCGVCGSPTLAAEGGHTRLCTGVGCGVQHFPRTDPAVIMLIYNGDDCLLGRQAAWRPGMYSTLAGFVEPGESLEEAVQREVMEEVGVAVGDVTYHSSQPWPFPSSIMLGFYAVAEARSLRIDHSEIEQAQWFSRDQIRREADQILPPRSSIARRLIDDWAKEGY